MSEIKDFQTKEYWDRRTKENLGNPKRMLFRDDRIEEYEKRTREELVKWHNLNVLDVCCGYGRIADLFDSYEGVDFSEEMIKLAKEKNPEKYFHVIDVNHATTNSKFDVIFEVNSLHCLGLTPEEFFEKYKSNARVAVACLEADRFTIFQIYGN